MKTGQRVGCAFALAALAAGSIAAASGDPRTVDFDKAAIKPTPAQVAAIRRATAGDLEDALHPGQPQYEVAQVDLNDDGRPDLIIQYTFASGFCGSSGCGGLVLMATPNGYARKGIGLPSFDTLAVLPSKHHGMHALQFNGNSPIWRWNGKEYAIAKADLSGANAPAWETCVAACRKLALVVPIDSAIKTVSLF